MRPVEFIEGIGASAFFWRVCNARGSGKQSCRPDVARFFLQRRRFSLPFYVGTNERKKTASPPAFVTDELTGEGAYGAGRYADAPAFKVFPPKSFAIEFNFAYNPNCARSPFFTCPFAFDRLALAVTAGERDPHAKH